MVLAKAPVIYLMGPSGSGKDSILRMLAARDDAALAIARRHITRPARPGDEDHHAVSEAAFAELERRGEFALCWRSHGLAYGIHHAELAPRERGVSVLMNGSRAYLDEARARIDGLVPVRVAVDPARLAERLQRRGREDSAQIARRLARNEALAASDDAAGDIAVIHNDGTLAAAAEALLERIRRAAG